MRRRHLIALLGGAAILAPLGGTAQQSERVRRIAMLMPFDQGDAAGRRRLEAVREGLRKLGWSEGSNLQVDVRWLGVDPRAHGLATATELVQLKPEVIFSASTPVVTILKQATSSIPVIFAAVADPVGSGLVANLARPGGNITGFTSFEPSLAGKWVELLKEIAPATIRVSLIYGSQTGLDVFVGYFESACRSFGATPVLAPVRGLTEIENALEAAASVPNSGIVLQSDVFLLGHREAIIGAVTRHRLPAVYSFRDWAVAGGLLSYGPDLIATYRQASAYIDRILRGANPAELPVQQPTKFELVINLKAAKALGIAIPQSLQQLADDTLE
jgi:putative ABC transport system substrate-binding protein